MKQLLSSLALVGLAVLLIPTTVLAQTSTRTADLRETVTCHSNNHKFQSCHVGLWEDAELVQQASKTRCIRGTNWDLDGTNVWVTEGCRATFAEVTHRRAPPPPRHVPPPVRRSAPPPRRSGPTRSGWQPTPSWDQDIRFSCGSNQRKYKFCTIDVGARGQVRLLEQESRADCIEGKTWGWNRAGIWTDDGCRAKFMVERRW